ncbi:uncharacterized protein Triagg1_10998 [Trichoderma aggressivum f. europaeum]|uniref:Uncharacterized protein n=1 Tax=Trichoderma aggressivum f. europaeum TaxID=173218 RepID=A0AAE1I4S0_9HYPO|nr:hypothetical protein Triagg1_10998 [Trichoderma aggressivum f. europaeum]
MDTLPGIQLGIGRLHIPLLPCRKRLATPTLLEEFAGPCGEELAYLRDKVPSEDHLDEVRDGLRVSGYKLDLGLGLAPRGNLLAVVKLERGRLEEVDLPVPNAGPVAHLYAASAGKP